MIALIVISLVSHYPEAISLKDITAESVAEGLIDIYSSTGIPRPI